MTVVSFRRMPRPLTPASVLLVALLAGCGTPHAPVDSRGEPVPDPVRPPPPVEGRAAAVTPGAHIVARGDTLYSIAWRYGLDYRDIARWNGIAEPYVIHLGRTLRLSAPAAQPAPVPRAPGAATTVKPATPQVTPSRTVPPPSRAVLPAGPIRWQWPVRGRIVRSDSPTSRKGIDIAGTSGQPVHAAAAGSVVYSGSGLLGYGRLIIVKHSDTFLSAYAYNEQLLVAEGEQVTAGQQIATMGTGTSGQPMLHFEIRRDGKPVNPLEHLPRSD